MFTFLTSFIVEGFARWRTATAVAAYVKEINSFLYSLALIFIVATEVILKFHPSFLLSILKPKTPLILHFARYAKANCLYSIQFFNLFVWKLASETLLCLSSFYAVHFNRIDTDNALGQWMNTALFKNRECLKRKFQKNLHWPLLLSILLPTKWIWTSAKARFFKKSNNICVATVDFGLKKPK